MEPEPTEAVITQSARSVLFIGQDPEIDQLIDQYARDNGDQVNCFETVPTLDVAMDQLRNNSFDLILVDLESDNISTDHTFQTLREQYPEVPVVILTDRDGEQSALRELNAGPGDYLIKENLTSHWLERAIDFALERGKSEHRYKTIFTESRESILVHKFDGTILDVNGSACEQVGYDRDELVQMTMDQMFVEDLDEILTRVSDGDTKNGVGGQFERTLRHQDGSTTPVEISLSPVTFRGQGAVMAFLRDITDSHKTRQQYRDANQRFKLAEDMAAIGHWSVSLPDKTLTISDQVARVLGTESDDPPLSLDSFYGMFHEDDRPAVQQQVETALEKGGELDMECRIRPDGGDVQWISFHATTRYDADGHKKDLFGVFREITAYKEALNQLEERYKEQRCLQMIASLTETDHDNPEDFLRKVVNIIPKGYQSPAETSCRISYDGIVVTSRRFKRTDHGQTVGIQSDEEDLGTVEVFVEEDNTRGSEGFLTEEHDLLAAVVDLVKGQLDRLELFRQREQSRRQLEASERRFRQLAENISEVFWIKTPDGNDMKYVSPAYEEIWGRSVGSLYENPESWMDSILPEDRERVIDRLPEQIEGGYEIEYRIRTAEGEIRWIHDKAFPLRADDGEVYRIVGVAEEITDQKRRENQLEQAISKLKVLFDNSPDMIDVLDADGLLVDVNERFCRELGYEEDEVLGRPIWEIDQEVDEGSVRELMETLELNERRRFEGLYERKEGSTFPVEVHLLKLIFDGRERFLAISRDITDRKRNEQLLEEQKRELEEALEDKTILLQEVHHRVRNNLQNVISLLTLTARSSTEPGTVEALKKSVNRVRSIAMVHHLLHDSEDLTSIATNEYVRKLVNTVVKDLWPEKPVSINYEIPPGVGMDPDRLTTVGLIINELVSNAFEHAFDENGGALSIRLSERDGDIELIVEDDGPGIGTEELEGDSDRLGLTVVHNLAETQLGGRMDVTSEDGTRFRITFPVEGND